MGKLKCSIYLLEDWFAVVSSDGTVTLHVDVCLVLCRTYTTVRYGVSLSVLPGDLGVAHKVLILQMRGSKYSCTLV